MPDFWEKSCKAERAPGLAKCIGEFFDSYRMNLTACATVEFVSSAKIANNRLVGKVFFASPDSRDEQYRLGKVCRPVGSAPFIEFSNCRSNQRTCRSLKGYAVGRFGTAVAFARGQNSASLPVSADFLGDEKWTRSTV